MKTKILLPLIITGSLMAAEEGVEKALEVWSLMSFFQLSLLLLLIGLLLHFAGGYYQRILNSFRIRLSGENFGIIFVLVRDLSLFAAFGIGAMLINPDIFGDIKLALPFVPLGTVFLGLALVVKLSKDIEKDRRTNKLFSYLLLTAAFLQYFGFVFVMEAAPEEWVSPGKVGAFWLFLRSLRSNLNPSLSMWTFYLTFPLIVIVFLLILLKGISGSAHSSQG